MSTMRAFWIVPTFLFALTACLDNGGRGSGQSGDTDAFARLDLSARNGRPGNPGATAGPLPTQVVYFDDSGIPAPVPLGVQAVGPASYTVNIQGAPVAAAAKALLGGILGVPYSVDPSATGTVTLEAADVVTRADVLMLFENALDAISDRETVFRHLPEQFHFFERGWFGFGPHA